MRRHPERTEQAGIVKLLRALGGAVYVLGTTRRKGDFQGTMMSPGLPDMLCFLPDGPVSTLLMIEVKAPKGRMSEEQRWFRQHCKAALVHHICGGLDDVIAWLIEHEYLKDSQVPHYRMSK